MKTHRPFCRIIAFLVFCAGMVSAQAQTNAPPVLAPAVIVDPLAAGRLFQRTNDPVAAASRSLNAMAAMAAENASLLSNQVGQIELQGSTAVASFGPHKVNFAANLNTPWAVLNEKRHFPGAAIDICPAPPERLGFAQAGQA